MSERSDARRLAKKEAKRYVYSTLSALLNGEIMDGSDWIFHDHDLGDDVVDAVDALVEELDRRGKRLGR